MQSELLALWLGRNGAMDNGLVIERMGWWSHALLHQPQHVVLLPVPYLKKMGDPQHVSTEAEPHATEVV